MSERMSAKKPLPEWVGRRRSVACSHKPGGLPQACSDYTARTSGQNWRLSSCRNPNAVAAISYRYQAMLDCEKCSRVFCLGFSFAFFVVDAGTNHFSRAVPVGRLPPPPACRSRAFVIGSQQMGLNRQFKDGTRTAGQSAHMGLDLGRARCRIGMGARSPSGPGTAADLAAGDVAGCVSPALYCLKPAPAGRSRDRGPHPVRGRLLRWRIDAGSLGLFADGSCRKG